MKGLTLVEVLVYLAILALFIVSAASMGYGLLTDTGSTFVRLENEENGRFLIRKLSWALSQADGVPAVPEPSILSVPAADPDLNPIIFRYDESARAVYMRAGAMSEVPITASGTVETLTFSSNGTGTHASARIGGLPFAFFRASAL